MSLLFNAGLLSPAQTPTAARQGYCLGKLNPAELLSTHHPHCSLLILISYRVFGRGPWFSQWKPRGHLLPPYPTSNTIPSLQSPHSSTAVQVSYQGGRLGRNFLGASDLSLQNSPSVTLRSSPRPDTEKIHTTASPLKAHSPELTLLSSL